MQNNNLAPNKLNEAVKEALNSDFEKYSDDDWSQIQPQLTSNSSSINPLNTLDLENLIKTNFEEHKKTILYTAIATLLIIIVISISYNTDEYSNETPIEPTNEVQPKETPIVKDTVRGLDTLKTISSVPIIKTIKDSFNGCNAYKGRKFKHQLKRKKRRRKKIKVEHKEEKKADSTREKTIPKVVKKKKNETDATTAIEEIEIAAPKPTMAALKKKRPKDSVENTKTITTQSVAPN